jgi:hypothetical protein
LQIASRPQTPHSPRPAPARAFEKSVSKSVVYFESSERQRAIPYVEQLLDEMRQRM